MSYRMEQFNESVKELIRKRSIACENLTEEQLSEALMQAILSGDFKRLVEAGTDRQQVVYIPYRDHEMLKSKIARLEKLLDDNNINHVKEQ